MNHRRMCRRGLIAFGIVMTIGFTMSCGRWSGGSAGRVAPALYPMGSFLSGPATYQGRVSTADPSGANSDYVMIAPGETWRAPAIAGPGEISRIWLTGAGEPYWEKFVVLRAYWDGAEAPAIDSPIGDFFLMGDGQTWRVDSLPIKVTRQGGGHTSYFVMPFKEKAVIEIHNQGAAPFAFWMHADYRQGPLLSRPLYFHARYRQEFPVRGWGDTRFSLTGTPGSAESAARVLADPAENYMILDVDGAGYYIGCYLMIENDVLGWVGEGDDRIVVDGEVVPRFHGTGLEDYFGSGFGFQRGQTDLFGVLNTHAGLPGNMHSAYRFHLEDPVGFESSIQVSVEHGEGNHRSDDYASVAYFYLDNPSGAGTRLTPAAQRLTSEMMERLLITKAFDDMAGHERAGDFAKALEVCERAIADSANPAYTEFIELKKAGLLVRGNLMDEARAWLERIIPRQTQRERRELAAALLEWLDDPDPAAGLLLIRGDDVFSCSLDGGALITGDLHRPWQIHPVELAPGGHRLAARVYNIGYAGAFAAAVLRRDGQVIVTGGDWTTSDESQGEGEMGRPGITTETRLYGYPAASVRSPWELNAFHILAADAAWIWGRTNHVPGQTMGFYYEWESGDAVNSEDDDENEE